jgi:hypothetical protein
MALSTVSGILTRIGMGKLGRLGLEQPIRYERSRPGELVHIDVKKLARIKGGAGWRVRGGTQHYNATSPIAPANDETLSATSTSRLPSTTTAGSPTPTCSPTKPLRAQSASSAAPSPSIAATALRSSGSLPTTARPTARSCTQSPAASSASATSARGPTAHKQTAKRSASSAPCSTAGPTARSTAQAKNAPEHLTAGSGTTTINADTQHSATNPPITRTNLLGSYS